jgi:hypothetical protein
LTKSTTLTNQLDALNSTTPKAGEWEAFLLESRLSDLVRAVGGVGNEQAHSVFLDFCKQATTALKLHQESLSSSPSVPILLDYLQHAMIRYIDAVANTTSIELTATDRRQALAEAFMMTGRRVSGTSEQLRIEVCHAFNCSIQEQTSQTGDLPTQKQLTTARRAAYRVYWGEEWIADEDTAKSRMKSVTHLLQAEGYDPGKVTID